MGSYRRRKGNLDQEIQSEILRYAEGRKMQYPLQLRLSETEFSLSIENAGELRSIVDAARRKMHSLAGSDGRGVRRLSAREAVAHALQSAFSRKQGALR